jgi:hypothetical protein
MYGSKMSGHDLVLTPISLSFGRNLETLFSSVYMARPEHVFNIICGIICVWVVVAIEINISFDGA